MHVLRSFADARALATRATIGKRAVILGSGFVGLEAAAALSKRGVAITIVSRDGRPMGRQFGDTVGEMLQRLHEESGVTFRLGRTANGFDGSRLTLDDGSRLDADFVLVGLGVQPRLDLARTAGLLVDDGVVVDTRLETSVPGIYAAGDIASYPDPITAKRFVSSIGWLPSAGPGRAANMLGAGQATSPHPFSGPSNTASPSNMSAMPARMRSASKARPRIAISQPATFDGDRLGAFLTVGRDRDNLEAEAWLEGVSGIAPPFCLRTGGG